MFALGDFTVNAVLTSLALLYFTHYLLVVVGLRPELAGAVQLIGRAIDAFADPAMGRISDRCRWRWGRGSSAAALRRTRPPAGPPFARPAR